MAGEPGEPDGLGDEGAIRERCGVLIAGDEVLPVLMVFSAVRTVPGLK